MPTDGFFVSLYDPVLNVRTACYAWGDGEEVDVAELPSMPVTSQGPNSRAVTTGKVIITDDYMQATKGHPSVIVGPDNGTRPRFMIAIPMAVMGRIIGTIEVQSYLASALQTRTCYCDEHGSEPHCSCNRQRSSASKRE